MDDSTHPLFWIAGFFFFGMPAGLWVKIEEMREEEEES